MRLSRSAILIALIVFIAIVHPGHSWAARESSVGQLFQEVEDTAENIAFFNSFVRGTTADDKKLVREYADSLKKRNLRVNEEAAEIIAEIGISVDEAVEALIKEFNPILTHRGLRLDPRDSLVKIGPAAVPELLVAAMDNDISVNAGAIMALGQIGPEAKDAVPFLIKRMNNSTIAGHVALALVEIGDYSKISVDELIDIFNNEIGSDGGVTRVLAEMGPRAKKATPFLLDSIKKSRYGVNSSIPEALVKINPDGEGVIPVLIEKLKDPDMDVQLTAAEALGKYGPKAKAAAPILGLMLEESSRNDESGSKRKADEFFGALLKIGLESAETYNIIKILMDTDSEYLNMGLDALLESKTDSADVVQLLIKVLGRKDVHYMLNEGGDLFFADTPETRKEFPHATPFSYDACLQSRLKAYKILDGMGAVGKAAIPRLEEIVNNPESQEDRIQAVDVLEKICRACSLKPNVDDTIMHEIKILKMLSDMGRERARGFIYKDENPDDETVIASLLEIGKPALPVLIEALQNDEKPIRANAATILSRFGPDVYEYIPDIIEAYKYESTDYYDFEAHTYLTNALASIGEPALPHLIKALNDENPDVTRNIMQVFFKLGPKAAKAAPDLIKIVDDEEHPMRSSVIYALGNIGTASEDVIPAMLGWMHFDNEEIRKAAIINLAEVGLVSDEVLPAIKDLYANGSDDDRESLLRNLQHSDFDPEDIIPIYSDALKDDGVLISSYASHALKTLDHDTTQTLIENLNVRFSGAPKILAEKGPETLPAMMEKLEDADIEILRGITDTIDLMGPEAINAVPELLEYLLNSDDPQRTGYYEDSLAGIGPKARPALQAAQENADPADKDKIERTLEKLKTKLGYTMIKALGRGQISFPYSLRRPRQSAN